ncbi:uncharacterized protein METZ01_LOCUS401602 [marine metagenome]|uniref:Uncharacterized protein n=1 Tax=marine metagenome TaxID=408172 RepID=A0A382VS68_9ZZZZ
MQIDHQSVQQTISGNQIGIKVVGKIRKKDGVYKKQ